MQFKCPSLWMHCGRIQTSEPEANGKRNGRMFVMVAATEEIQWMGPRSF